MTRKNWWELDDSFYPQFFTLDKFLVLSAVLIRCASDAFFRRWFASSMRCLRQVFLLSILPLVVADSASSFHDTKINKKILFEGIDLFFN
jgi:hypothetical protein